MKWNIQIILIFWTLHTDSLNTASGLWMKIRQDTSVLQQHWFTCIVFDFLYMTVALNSLCVIMCIFNVLSRCKWMWWQPMWWECCLCRHCWQFCLYMQRGFHWWSIQRMCWWVIYLAVINVDYKLQLLYKGI